MPGAGLQHCGSENWLMIDPDTPAAQSSSCAKAFLYSDKSLDPTPKNAEARMRIMPKLKTKNEGDAVMGNDQIRLHFVNEHILNMTCLPSPKGTISELNAMDAAELNTMKKSCVPPIVLYSRVKRVPGHISS